MLVFKERQQTNGAVTLFSNSCSILTFSLSGSCWLEQAHYIIASDLELCEVPIYVRVLRKISDNFLTNKSFFHFSRFSFISVVSVTCGCNVLGSYATSFLRSSTISYKNLKIVRLQSHYHRIYYEKRRVFC